MKWLLPLLMSFTLLYAITPASAQEADSTASGQGGIIDSLRAQMRGIEKSYMLLKERTDSTKHFTESDRLELEKLSQEMTAIGEQLTHLTETASRLADDAASVYDLKNAVVKNGDYTISDNEVVDHDVKVLNGDAFIHGTLNGSIVVVNGDAYVRGGAKVTGDVIVVNGRAHVSRDAEVSGNIIERGGADIEMRHGLTEKLHFLNNPDIWAKPNFLFDRLAANYNRVDGLFLGIGQRRQYYWSGAETFSPFGFVGYAFALHRWRYQVGLDKWFGNRDRFEVGIEAHSLTDSKDYWIIGPKENSLYSILAKEDFMDYFSRDGMSVHIAQYYRMNSRVKLSFDVDKYSSLSGMTNWSIFGGHKSFRPNPPVTDGWMRSVVIELQHREYRGDSKRIGWLAGLRGETTVSGAFDFSMLTANIVRYQPLFRGVQLNMRLVGGTSRGLLPPQRNYQIGGFNTLNAFPYKEFTGNRLVLFNAELLLSPELFKRSHFFPLNTVTLILFSDVGEVQDAGTVGMTSGWESMKLTGLKSDYGVGLGNGSGSFRIFLAWRTDISAPPTFGIRIARPF